MTQINLLPWREQARQKLKIELAILFAIFLSFTLFVIIVIHLLLAGIISRENARVDFLQTALGDRGVAYRHLKDEKKKQDAMMAELDFLYTLRMSSYQAVQLTNELNTLVPSTIILERVVKEGNKIVIDGETQTELEITHFMKNIEASSHLNQPVLTRISEAPDKEGVTRVFELQVEQKMESPDHAL